MAEILPQIASREANSDGNSEEFNLLQLNLERERRLKSLKEQDSKANSGLIAELLAKYIILHFNSFSYF